MFCFNINFYTEKYSLYSTCFGEFISLFAYIFTMFREIWVYTCISGVSRALKVGEATMEPIFWGGLGVIDHLNMKRHLRFNIPLR